MDLIAIIRSLEELLYEVMGWLVFYPRTLWRIVMRPAAMIRYSAAEQGDKPAERYADALSPPLMLLITVLFTHFVAMAMGDDALAKGPASLVKSVQNLLIVRALIVAILPLMFTVISMQRRRLDIDRTTMREPFYSQCFLVVPFVLASQIAILVGRHGHDHALSVALAIFFAGLGWFLWAQTSWITQLEGQSGPSALGRALLRTLLALLVALGVATLIALTA
jgi:hypothetical protein